MSATRTPPAEPATRPPRASGEPRAVYVFQLPVRLAHWLLFFSIAVASLTGWWIGTGEMPLTPFGRAEMATVRFVHLVAGWVMVGAMVMRAIWFFTGNRFASWREWIPTTRARLREIPQVIKFYTLLSPRYPAHGDGHNVLAGLTYCAVFGLLSLIALTGISLGRTGLPGDWHATVAMPIAWLSPTWTRFAHHMGMWLIWGFVCHHVASSLLVDAETRGNLFGAIFSGWRPRSAEHPPAGKERAP